MSADSVSSQEEDAQAPLSVAEFSKRQVAMIDDGAGGMIEMNLESSFHHCRLSALEDADSSEIAMRLVSSVEQSLVKAS